MAESGGQECEHGRNPDSFHGCEDCMAGEVDVIKLREHIRTLAAQRDDYAEMARLYAGDVTVLQDRVLDLEYEHRESTRFATGVRDMADAHFAGVARRKGVRNG